MEIYEQSVEVMTINQSVSNTKSICYSLILLMLCSSRMRQHSMALLTGWRKMKSFNWWVAAVEAMEGVRSSHQRKSSKSSCQNLMRPYLRFSVNLPSLVKPSWKTRMDSLTKWRLRLCSTLFWTTLTACWSKSTSQVSRSSSQRMWRELQWPEKSRRVTSSH